MKPAGVKNGRCKLRISLVATLLSSRLMAATTYSVGTVTELTNAVAKAANGDTIVLASGTYDLSTLSEYKGETWGTMSSPDNSAGKTCLWFKKQLHFKGADETSWRTKTSENETILDGDNAASIFYAYTGSGRGSSFSHLTFRNGAAESGKNGGGVYAMGPSGNANRGKGIITNCVFRNCSAKIGGGTYAYTVYDSLYENCTAHSYGGGAYGTGNNSYSEATTNRFDGCEFRSCTAGECGGGLYFDETRELEGARAGYVANCVFTNCSAETGGALYEHLAGMVRGCRFLCNSSKNGAVCADYLYSCTLTNCTFEGNVASDNGGAVGKWKQVVDSRFTGNVATNYGGACAHANLTAIGCSFTENKSVTKRAGAMYQCTAVRCAFTNNYVLTAVARGGACAFVNARECTFSGVGDVSCGSYDRCVFDGVVSDPAPGNQHRFVFDCVRNGGASIAVTNCLVINCGVHRLVHSEGQNGEFVNCTFADNTIGNEGATVYCWRGTDYQKNASGDYRYFPSTNTFVNCIFSGNRRTNGTDADMALAKHSDGTDFGYCSLRFDNCLYTAGLENGDKADVFDAVRGNPRFVAGDAKFPGVPYYSIRYGSAARNAGVNADWMADATDMAGNARINDGRVDMGCYECYLPFMGMILFFR